MLIARICILILLLDSLNAFKLVCFFTNWSQYRQGQGSYLPKNIDPNLCTHIIYAFAKLSDGQLTTYEWDDLDFYKQIMVLKLFNPDLKVLISVGGATANNTEFTQMVNNDTLRANFVNHTLNFVQTYNFDGLDLDWEYPTLGDRYNFVQLCKELKTVFAPNNLLLTADMAAGRMNIDNSYNVSALSEYIDFFNLMTYDYRGPWNTFVGPNTPLYAPNDTSVDKTYNIDFTVNYYMFLGMPKEKIVLGLVAYGHSWTLANSSITSMYSSASGPGAPFNYTNQAGTLAYYEVCEYMKQGGWTRVWDNEQKVPYIYKGDQWASYDDPQSLNEKVNYIISKNLAGAIFWALDLDDFTGLSCGTGPYPLLNVVKSGLSNNTSSTTTTKRSTIPIPILINSSAKLGLDLAITFSLSIIFFLVY